MAKAHRRIVNLEQLCASGPLCLCDSLEKTKPISLPPGTLSWRRKRSQLCKIFIHKDLHESTQRSLRTLRLIVLRDGLVHGPENGVDEHLAECGVMEVVRMAQGGVENAGFAGPVGPGDRFGLLVGDGADQEAGCRFG